MPQATIARNLVPACAVLLTCALGFFCHPLVRRHAVEFAQPLPVVTNWGNDAFVPLACIAAFAAIVYAIWWRTADGPDGDQAFARACTVLLFFVPLVTSSDVYAYAGYGWQALHGINPYAAGGPLDGGSFARAVQFQWPQGLPACAYGPVFVIISALAVAAFHNFGTAADLKLLRGIAICALIIAAGAARRLGYDVRYFALHPVALWTVAEGHNDAVMIAAILWALALQRSRSASTVLLLTASAIKSVAATVALLRARATAGSIALAAAALALAALPLFATHGGGGGHAYYPQCSPAALGFFLASHAPEALRIAASAATALIVAAALAWRAWRLRDAAPKSAQIYAALALWALIPNAQPWYTLWLLVPAARISGSRAAAYASVVALTALVRYVPDAYGVLSDGASLVLAAVPCLVLLVAALGAPSERDSDRAGTSRTNTVRP